MSLRPNFVAAPSTKIMINIGALLDIPTGTYMLGSHGESLLNGGLGLLTSVVGIGNNFKSTMLHYMALSALDRMICSTDSSLSTYDTEINIHESHLSAFTKRFPTIGQRDIIQDQTWGITDKTVYYGDKWYPVLKQFLVDKKAGGTKHLVTTPFLDRDGKTLQKMYIPTFGEIDSFSAFETSGAAKMQDENELGDSGANTLHMRLGLAKMRFLMELPVVCASAYHYMLLTAHVGKDISMATGPMPVAPTKKLQHLKNGDKIKGVTDQFFFLMSNCWHAFNASPLINQGTKGPEYPRNPTDNAPLDTDLNTVSLRQLRSKSGRTGLVLEILVSQSEGVLAELTEFHFIKSMDRFGISGTLQHYALDLLPSIALSRTTIRTKIDTHYTLRRALNITAELAQMTILWRHLADDGTICTPKQLYDDLIKMGYDWDVLLNTRGWWTPNNDKHPIPYLSTMDLLNIRKNRYKIYWLEDDLKTIKKEYKVVQ